MNKKIELLAPAGNLVCLKAAVENGADAVYIGGTLFSARKNADNFNEEDMQAGIRYAHERNAKVYVTINTLLTNEEIGDLVNYGYQLAEFGVDGVIVQDLGVAHLLNWAVPQLNLHASTQMTVHNASGVNYLAEQGFTRVVLAREVSLEDIKGTIANTSVEIETFVHGALCVGYSGQCLMSSLIGGRSGNRGHCAQPCRMGYDLVDENGKVVAMDIDGKHLLSPKDLNMIDYIPKLIQAGISSLKVEGRMKRPEYVAAVIGHYRKAIDDYYNQSKGSNSKQRMQELAQMFNREFTTGYYFGQQGRDLMSYLRPDNRGIAIGKVTKLLGKRIEIELTGELAAGDGYQLITGNKDKIAGTVKELFINGKKSTKGEAKQRVELFVDGRVAVGTPVYKTSDSALLSRMQETYAKPSEPQKDELYIEMNVVEGEPIWLKATDQEGRTAEAYSEYIVEKAQKHPTDYDGLWKQLNRLGNTCYTLASLDANIGNGIIAPASELNKIRRDVIEELIAQKQANEATPLPSYDEYIEEVEDLLYRIPPKMRGFAEPKLSVVVCNEKEAKVAITSGADRVIAKVEGYKGSDQFDLAMLKRTAAWVKEQGKEIYLTPANLVPQRQEKQVESFLAETRGYGFDGIVVGNIGLLEMAKQAGWDTVFADYQMNIFNDLTVQKLSWEEIMQITLSPEMTLNQINEMSYIGSLPMEAIVHGNFPLMISEQCVVGSTVGNRSEKSPCSAPCMTKNFGLKDRMGMVFPLRMDDRCHMYILNTKTLNLYKKLGEVLKSGVDVIRIEAGGRGEQWIETTVKIYHDALEQHQNDGRFVVVAQNAEILEEMEPGGCTYGHFYRGVL